MSGNTAIGRFSYSPYSNIFYSYKGPQHQNDLEESESAGQIENNITKALLDVLWHCSINGDNELVNAFIKHMVNLKSSPPYDFELQKSCKSLHPGYQKKLSRITTKKKLLLICRESESELTKSEFNKAHIENRSSIPDGWIFSSNLIIALESKTDENIQPGQLKRHIKYQLKEAANNFNLVKQKTWLDVYNFFKNGQNILVNENNGIFIKQFCQYLELCGLGGFAGFTSVDFDFFKMAKYEQRENYDLRFALIGKMRNLAERIHEKVNKKYREYRNPEKDLKYNRELYEYNQVYFVCECVPIKIKEIKDPKEYSKNETEFIEEVMRQKAHSCVQISKDDVSVWARIINAGNQNGINKLLYLLHNETDKILKYLKDLNLLDYYIELYYDLKKNDKWISESILSNINLRNFNKLDIDKMITSINENKDNKGLTFALTKTYPKDVILKMSPDSQVKNLARDLLSLHPFIKFINGAKVV